ncbi:MAG: peptidoglycan DD-metalloendopeptidase family protein [Ruthenibacterium sp.]
MMSTKLIITFLTSKEGKKVICAVLAVIVGGIAAIGILFSVMIASLCSLRASEALYFPMINTSTPAEPFNPNRIIIHEYEKEVVVPVIDPLTGEPAIDDDGFYVYETKIEEVREAIQSPHMGVDFEARDGSYVVSSCGGVVTGKFTDLDAGYAVEITHDNGTKTIYKHLSNVLAILNEELVPGQPIGQIGTSGSCTPYDEHEVANVHFEVIDATGNYINPMYILKDWGEYIDIPAQLIGEYAGEAWEDWAQSDVPGYIEWTGEKYLWPLQNYSELSSDFGWRVLNGHRDLHRGIDIPAPKGTPIYAAAGGVVSITAHWSYGVCVKISVAGNMVNIYGHMASRAAGITDGVTVTAGQLIGYVGSTGNSLGNHLHFEVDVDGKPVSPKSFF